MYSEVILLEIFLSLLVESSIYEIPLDFKLGVATSAFQTEGGWNIEGKGESIWDKVTQSDPDFAPDHSNTSITCDSYDKWMEDVKLMKDIGVNHYRFSISWPRILPTGYTNVINLDGIRYYNNVINALLENDIEPMVTIFHFDLPQPLQDLGGFANDGIAINLEDYARILFQNFGDRVKTWITVNEPKTYCCGGYSGTIPPLVHSDGIGTYLCGRNMLLAHARIYRMYEKEFKDKQEGKIGIAINSFWFEAKDGSSEAKSLALKITFGWFMNPIFTPEGNYPDEMINNIANYSKMQNFSESRLPNFTNEEISMIRGSSDFLGLNYYTSKEVELDSSPPTAIPSAVKDIGVNISDIFGAEKTASTWLQVYPEGLRHLLNYIKEEYSNPPVIITENGYPDNDGTLTDLNRIIYISKHLAEVMKALDDGCNVIGYTYWSLLDNFELNYGFSIKFGLVQVDFDSPNRTRTPKLSSKFYKNLIKYRMLILEDADDSEESNEY